METITLILIISAIISIIGMVLLKISKCGSGLEIMGLLVAAFGAILSFVLIIGGAERVKRIEYTYLTPNNITKTIDGFTVASWGETAIISDRAILHLTPVTNIYIEIANKYNYWNVRLNSSTQRVTSGKPNEIL